ncbi:MAG: DMT family transporter [Planctomycetota bacterium]|nr:MAG: DMT family transporter [Planctomycetota bacterium]
MAHDRQPDRQGEDRVPDAEAARCAEADRRGALEAGRSPARLLRGQRLVRRGGARARSRLRARRFERGGGARDARALRRAARAQAGGARGLVRARAIALIAAANVLGGLSYVGQKFALDGLPPATITCIRNLVGLACLGAWVAIARISFARWSRADFMRAALLGTAAYGLPMLLGVIGIRMSTSANGSILILLEPCAILFLCWLLLRERLGVGQILGVALGLVGALSVVLDGAGEAGLADLFKGEYARGNAILALHGILWGLYTPISKELADKHGAVEITFLSVLFSLVLIAPWSFAERAEWHAGPQLAPALAWSIGLGVLITFVSTVLWLAALKHLEASFVAVFIFLQPLAGVLAGMWLLDEPLSTGALWGGLVIAAGVLVSTLWPGKRPGNPLAEPAR